MRPAELDLCHNKCRPSTRSRGRSRRATPVGTSPALHRRAAVSHAHRAHQHRRHSAWRRQRSGGILLDYCVAARRFIAPDLKRRCPASGGRAGKREEVRASSTNLTDVPSAVTIRPAFFRLLAANWMIALGALARSARDESDVEGSSSKVLSPDRKPSSPLLMRSDMGKWERASSPGTRHVFVRGEC